MRAPRPATVLAFGLGALIQPLTALAGWLIWQVDIRPRKGA